MTGQATDQATIQVTGQVQRIVSVIGKRELSSSEIMEIIGLKHWFFFKSTYLNPALEGGFIEQTHPDKPRHPNQKYRLTAKGKSLL